MGLVRIRHGVAQHAMKSRVRAYKNRAKGSGWHANWREHFCHSLTLKTSVIKGINAKSEILKRKRKVEGRGRGRERKRKGKKEEGKGGKGNWK